MGYRIEYGQTVTKEIIEERTGKNGKKMAYGVLAAVIAAAVIASCVKTDAIRKFLLPGDPVVTEGALTAFAEDIRAGEPMGQSITAFCREIIEGADIS